MKSVSINVSILRDQLSKADSYCLKVWLKDWNNFPMNQCEIETHTGSDLARSFAHRIWMLHHFEDSGWKWIQILGEAAPTLTPIAIANFAVVFELLPSIQQWLTKSYFDDCKNRLSFLEKHTNCVRINHCGHCNLHNKLLCIRQCQNSQTIAGCWVYDLSPLVWFLNELWHVSW